MNRFGAGKMKKAVILFTLLTVAALAGGFWFWHDAGDEEKKQELIIYGNVDIRQVELAFNQSERVAEILVEEGEPVKKDQLLARLRPVNFELAVNRTRARLAAQKDIVNKLKAGTRKEDIALAEAQAQKADVAASDAVRTYLRFKALRDERAISEERLDNLKARADTAQAEFLAARARLERARAGPRAEDIAAAESRLRALEAELAIQQQRLSDSALHAPAAGVVRNRILQPGDMASPRKPVLTLALANPVWIRAYVSETDLGKIRLGMQSIVKTDSFPEKSYSAWIGYISPVAEFTPKNVETTDIRTRLVYQVRIYACNPDDELRLGMPATVKIPLAQSRSPQALPECRKE
jgi:HlyD family secretion protein